MEMRDVKFTMASNYQKRKDIVNEKERLKKELCLISHINANKLIKIYKIYIIYSIY